MFRNTFSLFLLLSSLMLWSCNLGDSVKVGEHRIQDLTLNPIKIANAITGPWEIEMLNFVSHPFELDSLILLQPDSVEYYPADEYGVLENYTVITGDKAIYLLEVFDDGDAIYSPNFQQNRKNDISDFISGTFSASKPDTLTKQYSSVNFHQNGNEIIVALYNGKDILALSNKDSLRNETALSKLQEKIVFNYQIRFQSEDKIVLVKK
jgi:hypothetical protein